MAFRIIITKFNDKPKALPLFILTHNRQNVYVLKQTRSLATQPAIEEKCPFQPTSNAAEKPKPPPVKTASEKEYENALPYDKIPGPRAFPGISIAYLFVPGGKFYKKSILEMNRILREEYGDLVHFPGIGGAPELLLSFNPEDIAKVYRTEGIWPYRRSIETFNIFRKSERPDLFKDMGGLLSDQGQAWQTLRTKINPVMMQPKTVKMYIPVIDGVVNDFITRIKTIRDSNNEMPKDFLNEMNKWALESIGCIALDTRLGCLGNLPKDDPAQILIESVHDFFALSFELEFLPSFWRYYKTPAFKRMMKTLHNMTNITLAYIDKAIERIEKNPSNKEHPSVLEKLLKIDRKIAVVMALDMLMAGVDTTSTASVGLLYQLAKNPEKQEILRKEIREKLPNKDSILTPELMANMPYLRACRKESTRTNSVVSGTARAVGQNLVLQGYQIPKGKEIILAHMLLSNDNQFFPRADEFLPERWLKDQEDENVTSAKATHPFSFMPFGFGPRMCIGKRFAEVEIDILVSRIIRNFQIEWHYPDLKYESRFLNTPVGELKFRFIDLKD